MPPQFKDPCSYLKGHFNESLFMSPTNEDEILNIPSSMNNSAAGHDGIDIKAIKGVAVNILTPLTHICNFHWPWAKFLQH